MNDRRWTAQELRRAARQGAVIRSWGRDSVRWDPRRPRDPEPWEGLGDVRYSSRECHPENPDGSPWAGPKTDDHGNEELPMSDTETGRMQVTQVPENIEPRSAEDKRRTYEESVAKARETRLARDLIGYVGERLNHEAGLLQWRINEALRYMAAVEHPNTHTLEHVRRYLTGGCDNER